MRWKREDIPGGIGWRLKAGRDLYDIVYCLDPLPEKPYSVSGFYWKNERCNFAEFPKPYQTLREAKEAVKEFMIEQELSK